MALALPISRRMVAHVEFIKIVSIMTNNRNSVSDTWFLGSIWQRYFHAYAQKLRYSGKNGKWNFDTITLLIKSRKMALKVHHFVTFSGQQVG